MDKHKNISWKKIELLVWRRFFMSLLMLIYPIVASAAIYAVYVEHAATADVWGAAAFGMLVAADCMVLVGIVLIIFNRGWVLYSFLRFAAAGNLPELKRLIREERLA